MEKNNNETEMLERILTIKEIETLKKAYSMLKSTDNEEFKKTLLRRIDDVLSMIRYIEISYPTFNQVDYDALSSRLSNLEITMLSIKQPEDTTRSFNYLADRTNTPIILRTIECLDNQRFYEIGTLLSSIANGTAKEITVDEELKLARGETEGILYLNNEEQILVYDIVSRLRPKIKKKDLASIKEKCLNALEEGLDPTVQKIYDEMVFQALHFNVPEYGNGFALTKKRDFER